MKRKLMYFFLIAGAAIQLDIVMRPFLIRELTLKLGQPVLFEANGGCLANMMQGSRTVHLDGMYLRQTLGQPSDIPFRRPIYLILSTNAQGVAQFDGFQARRPSSSCLYISAVMGRCPPEQVKVGVKTNYYGTAPNVYTQVVDVTVPTDKYVAHFDRLRFDDNIWAKDLPPRAEASKYFGREWSRQAVVRLWRGYAVVEDVLFDGKPSREYIREAVRLRREAERAEQK